MAEILQEFLVPIRFKVDQASEAQMRNSIRTATLQSNLLADAIEGAMKSFGQIMAKVASNMDELFFSSQRMRTSAENIKAFEYAARQLGASAGEAHSALEAFAKFMRSNPGSENWLKKLGITMDGKDNAQLLQEFGQRLSKMPRYMQQQYAGLVGLSDKMLFALTDPKYAEFAEEQGRLFHKWGLDVDSAKDKSNAFWESLRRAQMVLATIAIKIEGDLVDKVGGAFRGLSDFLVRHGDDIAKTITAIVEAAAKVGGEFLKGITGTNDLDAAFVKILKTIRELSKWIEHLVDQISDLIRTVNKFGESSGITWLLNRLGYYGPPNENPGTGPSGGAGGVIPPGGLRGGGDTRNWWQRHAPSWLGGKDAPEGGGGGGAGLGPVGGGKPAARSAMMKYAMDQLRKEGVPEANLRAAAAHLVGQADMESSLNPRTVHDGGTGYGIYGARLDRRSKMFAWLDANGFARDSAEGQMRYMAHEAMNGKYKATRRILMNASPDTMTRDSWTITGEFEAPKVNNNRSGAVAQAYRAGGEERQTAGGGVIGSVFGVSPAQAEIDRRWQEYLNRPKQDSPFGGLPGPDSFRKPLDGGINQNWNRTTTNNLSLKTDIKVDGAADPATTAALIGSRVDVNHRNFADRLRNFQGAAQ